MGEETAALESIGCSQSADGVFRLDNHPHNYADFVCLYNCFVDKFICVHSDASGYIALRFDHILEDALMIKKTGNNGEMSIGF